MLEAAGIDTSVFTAHSVRGALSSVAANLGIATNYILKAADWSSESVFQSKPTEDPSFGRAVLSTKDISIAREERSSWSFNNGGKLQ